MVGSIMIQGAMSGAGKSLLTAALCRIFKQDGYRAAPFKSQNMALNSYVTRDGLEIGRAQAMQAEAADVEPSVMMNPVLLKPTTDRGSQVIVNGRVRGEMRAADYFRYKKSLVPEIMEAYYGLARRFDIVVIEGAGSPAELNLKKDDIVNMGLAKLTDAPVLLAGDIDRGGIFAQLLGTLMLLEPEEKAMVKGLVVNKFRGDRRLFEDGVKILEDRSGKPVAGVIPWIDVDLDEEDSLSEKLENKKASAVDIAVVRLPKISNFTDFDAFARIGTPVRYVSRAAELGSPDIVILPGTKSTLADMGWLRKSGLEPPIKSLAASGTPIFGVCGGYQLLGGKISDPEGSEGGGEVEGLGLLNMETVFKSKKTLMQKRAEFAGIQGFFSCLEGLEADGYEIHMGETVSEEAPLFVSGEGSVRGNVCGCYLHGVFDSAAVPIVKSLCEKKGIEFNAACLDKRAYKDLQYNKLAEAVRKNLDMELIYKIIREGI